MRIEELRERFAVAEDTSKQVRLVQTLLQISETLHAMRGAEPAAEVPETTVKAVQTFDEIAAVIVQPPLPFPPRPGICWPIFDRRIGDV